MASTGLKLAQIAKRAGVSDTTLSRLVNDADYQGTLSPLTVERIKEAFRVPGPGEAQRRVPHVGGFAEAQRVELHQESGPIADAIAAAIAGRLSVAAWRLKTEALSEVGFLPGDVVLVDTNALPEPQDAVCAQVYEWQSRGETVWRVYDPPFLVAAARDRTAYKPLLVDNERVVIKGVVIACIRAHRLSAIR